MGRTLSTDFDDDDVPDLVLDDARGAAAAPAATKPAQSYEGQGRTLDDDFSDDDAGGDLELDIPAGHGSQRSIPAHPADFEDHALPPPVASKQPPSSSSGRLPSLASSSQRLPTLASSSQRLPDVEDEPSPAAEPRPPAPPAPPPPPPKPTPAAIVAKYPPPPQKVWETPLYAWKVLYRQVELRQDLASLRKRRSPDVPLYEAALKAHDQKTFLLGLALTCAGIVVACFVFFLPVIIRQIGD
jgi:hypothetical protein